SDRPDEQSEVKLNSQLATFLDVQASNSFPMIRFNHEEPQSGSRSTDISSLPSQEMFIEARSYTIYDPVLVIECKRLPAPSKDREKEYVTGLVPNKISGGIQRFKLGLHGAKHNSALMVGYIQDGTAKFLHKKINKWICELMVSPIGDGCTWSKKEILVQLEEDTRAGVVRYHSKHSRKGKATKIELYHLWVVMTFDSLLS
ncbi:hypothetical protein KAR91_03400, partial [Candidatus Pacearchaeota archaeon]|nr:hypothetical protein [Candidatus Pacearchaeota archaeon]